MAAGSVAALGTIIALTGVTIIKVTAVGGVLAAVISVKLGGNCAMLPKLAKSAGVAVLMLDMAASHLSNASR